MAAKRKVGARTAAKKLVEDFMESDNDFGLDPEKFLPVEYELTEADREDLESRIERALLKAIEGKIRP
jgi:hypothetical protein